ncbi:MAG: DinB family protein [Bacteroidales bacterium]|nr:DinB family protein [Bacteroidales bacterium]
MTSFQTVIDDILVTIEKEEPILRALSEEIITTRLNQQNRSIKMLIGHLVDSASNNHQRMVRLQYAPRCGHSMPNTEMGMLVFPDYTQDNDLWIALQDYQHADWQQLLSLWKFYNLHMVHVIRSVDKSKLNNYWIDYEGCKVTLHDMIMGYTSHLHLHLGQIHELMGE